MKTFRFLPIIGVILLWSVCPVCAQEAIQSPAAENTDANVVKIADVNATVEVKIVNKIAIAIIDFESKAPGNPELGSQIGDILTARLSVEDQFQLIERQKLEGLLEEHQLNLSGMVDTSQAIKVGKLLGARIMIFGRAFVVDKDLYIVAKIVGTETSLVKGVIAKGKTESNLSDIIDQLVDKLAEGLVKWAPQLLPKNEKLTNKVEVLKKKLAGKKLPTVAIIIPEEHMNRQVVDPAAETEVKNLFKKVGFTIIEIKGKTIPQWARDFQKDPKKPIPPDFSSVDIIITGEGFSEFGARFGGLVSCTARLEVQATECSGSHVVASERTTRRAVDLSETIAGKTALQAAGHELAIKLIETLAQEIVKD